VSFRHRQRGKALASSVQGASKALSTRPWLTGDVVSVDPDNTSVQVNVLGGIVWLPAAPDRYSASSGARVLLDARTGRPELVIGAVTPDPPYKRLPVTATGSGTVTVTWWGAPVSIPAVGTYTAGQAAEVLMDEWNQPIYAMAPNSTTTAIGGTNTAAPTAAKYTTATASIGPQVSGTYRSAYSRWADWNTTKYGGAADIYQGNSYGSGPLIGFAGYGNQISNLGATSIQSITMRVYKDADGNSATCVVRGSAFGSEPGGAPSSSGDEVAVGVGSGGWATLAFTANMCEGFRTGAFKGLCAVGGDYGGFGGTSRPGSFALTVHYTRKV
jgi:hypothetical protein